VGCYPAPVGRKHGTCEHDRQTDRQTDRVAVCGAGVISIQQVQKWCCYFPTDQVIVTDGTELAISHIRLRCHFFVSNLRRVLNVIFLLFGDSPASEFCMPTFRNTLSIPRFGMLCPTFWNALSHVSEHTVCSTFRNALSVPCFRTLCLTFRNALPHV